MPSTSLQFHLAPSEVADFAAELAGEFGLAVVFERSFPKPCAVRAEKGDFKGALESLGRVDRVVFGLSDLVLKDGSSTPSLNPDCMVLVVGGQGAEGIRESGMGANTPNVEAISTWRKIVRKVRARLLRGAVLVSWNDGSRHSVPTHRYTKGALQLSESGTPMLAFAGSNIYELGAEP